MKMMMMIRGVSSSSSTRLPNKVLVAMIATRTASKSRPRIFFTTTTTTTTMATVSSRHNQSHRHHHHRYSYGGNGVGNNIPTCMDHRRFIIPSSTSSLLSSSSLLTGRSIRQQAHNQNRSSSSDSNTTNTNTSNDTDTDIHKNNSDSKSLRQERILSSLDNLKKENTLLSNEIEFSINPYELERHGRGESHHRGFIKEEGVNNDEDTIMNITPDVIISPSTVQDVSIILKYCNENRIPVIPYGSGTSVEGHVCATCTGTISLDMTSQKGSSEFQQIVLPNNIVYNNNDDNNDDNDHDSDSDSDSDSITFPDPIATVGAGVTRKQLNDALRHTGMTFTVDPGTSEATIGGMVATGASGTTSVRYGTMKENILELSCVLPDGTIIDQIGSKALKSSAGYDLVSLMCGSEGTLGVITSITVKLHPIPNHVMAAVCVFDTISDAVNAVAMLQFNEIPVVRCELLDATSVAAFNNASSKNMSLNMEEKPTLFLEFQASSENSLKDQIDSTESICVKEYNGTDFRSTTNEKERKDLWQARHELYYSSIKYRKGATTAVLTDVCVPISKLAKILEDTVTDVQNNNIVGPCFGHVGDGNFHCILPIKEKTIDNNDGNDDNTDGETDEYMVKVNHVHENIIQRALDVNGTCTGEHGVGYGKMKYLTKQYGYGAVHMMKLIKTAIDPNNIMNPGKVV